jgi:DNA-binding CsgD family transcriptional regulator
MKKLEIARNLKRGGSSDVNHKRTMTRTGMEIKNHEAVKWHNSELCS